MPLIRLVFCRSHGRCRAGAALAQSCQKEATFTAWLAGVKAEALASGLSATAVNSALATVKFDPAIVKKDHAQGVFTQDFLTFAGRMVAAYRMKDGAADMAKYATTFARIEKTYGVPAPVLSAFWGLETDFGAGNGTDPVLVSLATLGYDCRRPDMFRKELLAALAIVDRGDLKPADMKGSWAGELGQLQFLATRYVDFGVDFDGDGQGQYADQRAGRAGLGGEVHPVPRMAGGRAVADRGRGDQAAAVGAGRHRDQAARDAMVRVGRNARRRQAHCPGRCPPHRCCCRWGGTARHSSPTPISTFTCSGTRRWSIRRPPRISRRALPARRRCRRGRRRWRPSARPRCARCSRCSQSAAMTSARSTG